MCLLINGQLPLFLRNMNACGKHLSFRMMASSLVMILALLWLTVSTPFVYAASQPYTHIQATDADDDGNPLNNTTEERSQTAGGSVHEILHDHSFTHELFSMRIRFMRTDPTKLYFAYNPELLSPPPECRNTFLLI